MPPIEDDKKLSVPPLEKEVEGKDLKTANSRQTINQTSSIISTNKRWK